jgi:hypothetical protein
MLAALIFCLATGSKEKKNVESVDHTLKPLKPCAKLSLSSYQLISQVFCHREGNLISYHVTL